MGPLISCILILTCVNYSFSSGIPPPPISQVIEVRKCCRDNEYLRLPKKCEKLANGTSTWKPTFFDSSGQIVVHTPSYHMLIGSPDCRSASPWIIFHAMNHSSCDEKLNLLLDGKLRHYVLQSGENSLNCEISAFEDYNISRYCIDKTVYEINGVRVEALVAQLCVTVHKFSWYDFDFVIHRIINPICHGFAIVCFLIVAVVYFVFPQLSDLVGNIITTLVICLIFEQVSDIIKIYDEYHSAISYLISDAVLYVSSLGAFFWLNGYGFYVWKTFRSRNVFLRISDGKKYCYYSSYAWGCTFSMSAIALFAHLILDTNNDRKGNNKVIDHAVAQLGMAVFVTTIVFTIIMDAFFCLSTLQVINRMSSYGRIHRKLKFTFQLFVKLFVIICMNWLFCVLAWLPQSSFFYMHVASNFVHAVAILYVTVFDLNKVRSLLSKACCYAKCSLPCCVGDDRAADAHAPEWGEEMMAMNRRT